MLGDNGLPNFPVVKRLILGIISTSVLVGIFELKSYLHINFRLHFIKYHQYWRLLLWQAAYWNSSEVFNAMFILYQSRDVEKIFGSAKFASYCILACVTGAIMTPVVASLTLVPLGVLEQIRPGPTFMVFAVLYQYFRIVPSTVVVHMLGLNISDKLALYPSAIGLALAYPSSTLLNAFLGWSFGMLWSQGLVLGHQWRLSAWITDKFVAKPHAYVRPINTIESQAAPAPNPSATGVAFANRTPSANEPARGPGSFFSGNATAAPGAASFDQSVEALQQIMQVSREEATRALQRAGDLHGAVLDLLNERNA
ncbi:UBA domain-containing protein Ucp14 [Schizosaccharomyces japonicus yFS275]|uniref:UBA domain-containing protein Ucp14 n=1 Tax=Schizosaccharomyces japonicus (strain yFS275 / FY16936) TaxID=402676 RepID=B6K3W0_SCHJY|nr:UBA domain-containing protein Ucp14 [Schizosaccharomyces japonicus yFS275]EEB08167.1 UBA domain-containing protein Ucp14 [Schizosaccharomyces japonicus yFS275]